MTGPFREVLRPQLGPPAGEFLEKGLWGHRLGLDLEIWLGSTFLPCESICLNFLKES